MATPIYSGNQLVGFFNIARVRRAKKRKLKKSIRKITGFGDLGHYGWETLPKKSSKQIKMSGWD